MTVKLLFARHLLAGYDPKPTLIKGFKLPFTPFRGLVIKEAQLGPPVKVLSWEIGPRDDFYWDPTEESFICEGMARITTGDVAKDIEILKSEGWLEYTGT